MYEVAVVLRTGVCAVSSARGWLCVAGRDVSHTQLVAGRLPGRVSECWC
jgi:hypothetical protein